MCWFKRKVKKIDTNLNISSKELAVCYKLKNNRIYLGTKIKVPRNFAFVISSNNKSVDVLYEDDTTIDIKTLPAATRKFSLYTVNKKGRGPKYFEAETHFVNLNVFNEFMWETAEYAELEDRAYGEYKTSCFGELAFKICDPIKFLDFILKEIDGEPLTPNFAKKILSNYINERVVRILNKANPTAKKLYMKDDELVKLIFEKLSELLAEKGIDLFRISLTETRFPPKIMADLKNNDEQPVDVRGWGKATFEEWHAENPLNEEPKKPKFVTIIPTGYYCPFFKESMAPYFFEDNEKLGENTIETEEEIAEPIWKGIDEKIIEEQSKKLVNLDDDADGNTDKKN